MREEEAHRARAAPGVGVAPNRLRQPVAEIQVGDEILGAGDEETVPTKPVLELSKGPVGLMELECQ